MADKFVSLSLKMLMLECDVSVTHDTKAIHVPGTAAQCGTTL